MNLDISYKTKMLLLILFSFKTIEAQDFKIKNLQEKEVVQLGANSKIYGSDYLKSSFEEIANSFQKTISEEATKNGSLKKIQFEIGETEWPIQAEKIKERYKIEISENTILVCAANISGLVQGVSRLERLLIENSGKLFKGSYIDWPSMEYRGMRIPIAGGDSPQEMKNMLTEARLLGYNFVVFLLRGGVALKTMEGLSFVDLHPAAASKIDIWSPEEFKEVVEFARGNGFLVIPGLKLLTHQSQLLQDKYSEIMYNSLTYDPSNPKTYEIVFPIIDEIIELIHPKHFNIGHDEVIGIRENHFEKGLIKENEKVLPASLFLKDVCILNNYFSEKGIQVWMAGDMLLSPEEFSSMSGPLNALGDYKNIRSSIPQEINIMDWHYKDRQKNFPTIIKMTKEGRFAVGMTWKRKETIHNFSNYVAQNHLPGMMAFLPGLRNKDFNFIFTESAKAFWEGE